jgi:hypothetical protein
VRPTLEPFEACIGLTRTHRVCIQNIEDFTYLQPTQDIDVYKWDIDFDGVISREEMYLGTNDSRTEKAKELWFEYFDVNQDGYVEANEIKVQ